MLKQSFVAALVFGAAAVVAAQQPGFTRTLLQQVDLSTPGREAVSARAEFVPGGTVGRHTHFVEEIGYVIEGALSVEINGVTKTVKAGEAFAIPAGAPHNATNAGPGKAAILATYIVEKGKPLATPVK
ncbi:MAG: cupin domain-containing protein [Acidobacteria bacterium]|nr:cupin domain-containing protein [Acidobacteriota bacterium]